MKFTLISNLEKTTHDLISAWERVSAAVCCAVYDPGGDSGSDSVFKRADALMHENKKLPADFARRGS